jgi:hypothetical protein
MKTEWRWLASLILTTITLCPSQSVASGGGETPDHPLCGWIITSQKIKQFQWENEGLFTLLTPTSGVTATHVVGSNLGNAMAAIRLDGQWQTRKIASARPLAPPNPQSQTEDLDQDACLISWDEPFDTGLWSVWARFPEEGWRPEAGTEVWTAQNDTDSIGWERRILVGAEGRALWTGVPHPLHQILRRLGGAPPMTGKSVQQGDSGGGWIDQAGRLIGVTSRITEGRGPNIQTIYASSTHSEPFPLTKEKGWSAKLPLLGTGAILALALILSFARKSLKRKQESRE